jgi:phosphoribosylformimino-5-aminoimidazole carboxamide ribotide isomerase
MDVIPVLDLAGGVAVWAVAGDRARYAPLASAAAPGRTGDALAIRQGYRRVLGATGCYVADLDAIQGRPLQAALLRELAGVGAGEPLLVDAGAGTPAAAVAVMGCGASVVVAGLESLRAFGELAAIVDRVGADRAAFSLDLRSGIPVLHPAMAATVGAASDPVSLAARAADAGVRTIILLDLGRVGTGAGVDLALLERLRQGCPSVRLLAGGGVRTRGDLVRLRDAGCDAALVASAVHAGVITGHLAGLGAPRRGGQSATSVSR